VTRCEDLGVPLTKEQLDTMYHRFTALADRKKGLRNDEIAGLAREIVEENQKAGAAAD
jgi:2-isopropylmalate synthase